MKKSNFKSSPFNPFFFLICVFCLVTAFTHHEVSDPIAILDHPEKNDIYGNSIISATSFIKATGVTIQTEKPYEITSFSLVRVGYKSDPIEVTNRQAKFNDRANVLINQAKSGDVYYFENIMAKLPTMVSRDEWIKLNSFVVKIE